jgi:disease resistance protein RPM1
MGGMGKSSVARSVYNDPAIVDGFDCRAWVTVPHPLDSAGEFKRRLVAQLETEVDGGGGGDDVSAWLRQKRYLIVVDDVRSLEEWEHIEPCLVESDAGGGRVIVTTRQVDVAQRCVRGMEHAYELKTLAAPHDMRLLCQKVRSLLAVSMDLHDCISATKVS